MCQEYPRRLLVQPRISAQPVRTASGRCGFNAKRVLKFANMTYQKIEQCALNGREFIISIGVRPCRKIGFYAHELGELTTWGKVMGNGEREAHRLNPSIRVKGRQFIPRPYDTIGLAKAAIKERSETNKVIYA